MVTFAVDAVVPASDRLPTRPLRTLFADALALGADPGTHVIDQPEADPLLTAVSLAFRQHRPLVLSPDVVWLTIARGIGQHISFNAESLRTRLVRHIGKETLVLPVLEAPRAQASDWALVVGRLRTLLAARIGEGRARFFECDFSTSTEVERIASQVVLLSSYAAYFDYQVMCICGIPRVTLTGTPDDWRRIRERIELLAEVDLEVWQRSLAPILDQFVSTARGDVDVTFWQRIYNPIDAYGGEKITGWVTRFYPYVKSGATVDQKNPMLELPIDEPRGMAAKGASYTGPGLTADTLPFSRASVLVEVTDEGSNVIRRVSLEGGIVAIAQDEDGSLRPVAGWQLMPAYPSINDVVARLASSEFGAETSNRQADDDMPGEVPEELKVLMAAAGTRSFFLDGKAWTPRPFGAHDYICIEGAERWAIRRVIDFPDGSCLCHTTSPRSPRSRQVHWLVCRLPKEEIGRVVLPSFAVPCRTIRALEPAATTRLLGSSLAGLLETAIKTRGDLEGVGRGTLADLLG